jgi:hypothetical protein
MAARRDAGGRLTKQGSQMVVVQLHPSAGMMTVLRMKCFEQLRHQRFRPAAAVLIRVPTGVTGSSLARRAIKYQRSKVVGSPNWIGWRADTIWRVKMQSNVAVNSTLYRCWGQSIGIAIAVRIFSHTESTITPSSDVR